MVDRSADPGGGASQAQAFYETYVEEHVPYHRSPRGLKGFVLRFLPYWSYREWRFWRRWVPPGCALLDLGCARGREIFRERARSATGVDLARNALLDCAREYDLAAVASLGALPFREASFDCVVSSHVMGHVPPEAKDGVVAEVARVLRRGGLSLHVIETDGRHRLAELAKADPELYRRRLLDPDGHVGLEPARKAVRRFERHGFRLRALDAMESGPLHPRLAVKWFDNEYREQSPEFDRLVRRAHATLASPLRLAAAEIGLEAWRRTLGQRPGCVARALFVAAAFERC